MILGVADPQSGSSSICFLVELKFGSGGFLRRGENRSTRRKTSRRERTNNKLNPHMASTPGFEPAPHRWEASALTTVQSLAPHLN